MLAPVIVVGPVYNGRLEERVWVCLEHWEKSVIDENKGDDDCEVAALEEESQEFFDVSPVVNRTRCNKGLTRKKLEFGAGPSKESTAVATSSKEKGDGLELLKKAAVGDGVDDDRK